MKHAESGRDGRESPSYALIEKREARGALVQSNDPHIPVIRPSRERAHLAGRVSVPITNDQDLILISTVHEELQWWDFPRVRFR